MTEQKVYIVLNTVRLDVSKQYKDTQTVDAHPMILGVFRNREDAQFQVDQFRQDANVWENYEILERELV